MDLNIEEAMIKDNDLRQGVNEFEKIDEKANTVAEEISSKIIETIVKQEEEFSITTGLLCVSKVLTHLASYLYDSEEEFLTDVKKARESVINDIIPALLDPQPCGKCQNCKNGNEIECINPIVRGDYTQSRFLPILCNMIIEYDLFNKVIHMYTVGKNSKDEEEN